MYPNTNITPDRCEVALLEISEADYSRGKEAGTSFTPLHSTDIRDRLNQDFLRGYLDGAYLKSVSQWQEYLATPEPIEAGEEF